MIKGFLAFMFVALSVSNPAFCGQDSEPGCDFNQESKKLRAVYDSILTQYKDDTLFIFRLKKAQRAWLKYRDAHIEARFPTAKKGSQPSEYGSIYPQCACMELTEERIRILEKWLKGTIEGDVCGGSYKIKQ